LCAVAAHEESEDHRKIEWAKNYSENVMQSFGPTSSRSNGAAGQSLMVTMLDELAAWQRFEHVSRYVYFFTIRPSSSEDAGIE
jgi:hypothetical protein